MYTYNSYMYTYHSYMYTYHSFMYTYHSYTYRPLLTCIDYYVYMYIHANINMYMYMYIHTCICIYIHIVICIRTCIYIYIRLVMTLSVILLQNQIVLKFLKMNSTPCVQYGLLGKVNVSDSPWWGTEHAGGSWCVCVFVCVSGGSQPVAGGYIHVYVYSNI